MSASWQHTWRWGALSTVVSRLALACAAAFVAEIVLARRGIGLGWLALSLPGVSRGALWQFVTYQFLHANTGHLLMNMLALLLIGPAAESTLGRRHLLIVFLVSGALGGLGFVLLDPRAPCVGASGSVFGVFGAFVALHPHERMTLLFFPFVVIEAWIVALLFGGIELMYLVSGAGGNVAYAAHVAGGLAGFVYARTVYRRAATGRPFALPRPFSRRRGPPAADTAGIDRILDKVAREGLASLTRAERAQLERAARDRRVR